MPDQNVTQWHPPQEKIIHNVITWGAGAVAVVVGAILVKTFVPTIADAFALLAKMTANFTVMAIEVAVAVAVCALLLDIFGKNGKLHAVFVQAYSSFVHNLTLELLNVDPISPLKDALAAAKAKLDFFNEQFAKFDGQIAIFKSKEQALRDAATKAERQAKIAMQQGNQALFNQLSYEQGTDNDTANNIAQMRQRLEPVRDIVVRLQSYAKDLIWKLDIDIKNTQIAWDAANSMTAMDAAARGIMKNSGKTDLALEAQNIVNNKYASAIGRLDNLSDMAKPLLDSADLDKGVYAQDLLAKWQAEDAKAPVTLTAQVVHEALPAPSTTGSFADLIRK